MRNKSNGVKKGTESLTSQQENGKKKGESGDQGKIVPYEESSGYRFDTYV